MKSLVFIYALLFPFISLGQCDLDWVWDPGFSRIIKCGKCRMHKGLKKEKAMDAKISALNEFEITTLTNYFNTICDEVDCCNIKNAAFVFRKINDGYYIDGHDNSKVNIVIITANVEVYRVANFKVEDFKINDQGILINGATAFLPVGFELIILPISALSNIDKAKIVSFQDNPSEPKFLDKHKRNTVQSTIRVAQKNMITPSYSYPAPDG